MATLNLDKLSALTDEAVSAGHRVFQIHRFAAGDRAHGLRLLAWADIPQGARVLDVGCGVGALSEIWGEARPDLSFSLLNISYHQLTYARGASCCADMHTMPFQDGSYDAAVLCFSIGHGDHAQVLRECARVLRPGGVLFLYDMVRVSGDHASLSEAGYTVRPSGAMERDLIAAGFSPDWYMEPYDSGEYGRAVLRDGFSAFAGTIPAIWRWVRA